MCGRFTQRASAERIAEAFGVREVPPLAARYNIAPTQSVLTVHGSPDGREARMLQWGLVPRWAKDPSIGARLINARRETVGEKPAFRDSFRRRRCLIAADGFYEWRRTDGGKQPFFFRLRDDRPFGFAGLWDRWEGSDGAPIVSCTILTTEANDVLRPVHDRMTVILDPGDYDLWLDPDLKRTDLLHDLLRPYSPGEMASHPVSLRVNRPSNDDPQCVTPLNSA